MTHSAKQLSIVGKEQQIQKLMKEKEELHKRLKNSITEENQHDADLDFITGIMRMNEINLKLEKLMRGG